MAEFSMWWTTGGAGDGAATYTRSDHAMWSKVLASCNGAEGVAAGYLNELAGTATALNTVQINTGGGLVDGKVYNNSAAVNVNIPSAVGAGNTRIDRIVLRASWAAQTVRITRIAGTDAASPTAPAITQVSGTTYDILLYQALVNTAGTVVVTDERTFARVGNTGIRKSAGLSVIGRSGSATGDVADITAAAASHILRASASGASIGWGQALTDSIGDDVIDSQHYVDGSIDLAHMSANSVDSDQYVDGSIDTVHLANDAVDDTKAGNRVPALIRRQGNSATDWSTAGTTDYIPTAVRMQAGAASTGALTWVAVTFPVAFSNPPIVLVTTKLSGFRVLVVHPTSASGFTVTAFDADGVSKTYTDIYWLAIGPE